MDTCPNCGCDLKKEIKKREKEIDNIIEERYKDVLKFPRKRAKFIAGTGGVFLGLLISSFLLAFFSLAINTFGVYLTELNYFLQFIAAIVSLGIVAGLTYLIASELIRGATPIEEKRIRELILKYG